MISTNQNDSTLPDCIVKMTKALVNIQIASPSPFWLSTKDNANAQAGGSRDFLEKQIADYHPVWPAWAGLPLGDQENRPTTWLRRDPANGPGGSSGSRSWLFPRSRSRNGIRLCQSRKKPGGEPGIGRQRAQAGRDWSLAIDDSSASSPSVTRFL